MEWKKRRDEKILLAQENRELEEEEACTFRPSISQDPGWRVERPVELTDFGKKGLVQYIERVDNARKKKQERDTSQGRVSQGKPWSNRITVPKEFALRKTKRETANKTPTHQGRVLVLVDGDQERHVEDKSLSIDYVPMARQGGEFEYALFNLHQKLHNFKF